jgi:hypothetical protein
VLIDTVYVQPLDAFHQPDHLVRVRVRARVRVGVGVRVIG